MYTVWKNIKRRGFPSSLTESPPLNCEIKTAVACAKETMGNALFTGVSGSGDDEHEVLVLGSLMVDVVARSERLPTIGETIFGDSFVKTFGGKGANQAVAVSRLGVKVSMCGTVGQDAWGTEYMEQLKQEGVDITYIRRCDDKSVSTGVAHIIVTHSGANVIVVIPGSNSHITVRDISPLEVLISSVKVLVTQNEIPPEVTLEALRLAKKHNTLSVFNPAPAFLQNQSSSITVLDLVAACDVVVPNETELAALTGLPTTTDEGIKLAAEKLKETGPRAVVVTLGDRGACLVLENRCTFYPAVKVDCKDTVGAGDSFIGTLAGEFKHPHTFTASIVVTSNMLPKHL